MNESQENSLHEAHDTEPDFPIEAKFKDAKTSGRIQPQGQTNRSPTAASLLLSTLLSLVVVLVLLVALRYLLPSMLESSRYSWYRGQLRAEYELAGQQLERVSLDGIPTVSQTVARRVCPSVVHITLDQIGNGELTPRSSIRAPGRPLVGQGSGVIIDSRGYILTNYHVINDEDDRISLRSRINVLLADERTSKADLVGFDAARDLALLKIESDNLFPITWGDSEGLELGAPVWAVGSPFGLTGSITFGILSGKHRLDLSGTSYGDKRRILDDPQRNRHLAAQYTDLMQSDVAVNPGNSGGPLVNSRGELIGINTAIIGEAYRGVSFAIPSSVVKIVFDQILESGESGELKPGWLGVKLIKVSEWQAKQGNEDPEEDSPETFHTRAPIHGAVVDEIVDQKSPAAMAGLNVGDLIVEIDQQPVRNVEQLIFAIGKSPIGKVVLLKIERDGLSMEMEVVIGKRPYFPTK